MVLCQDRQRGAPLVATVPDLQPCVRVRACDHVHVVHALKHGGDQEMK